MFLDKIELEADETVLVHTRRHWFVLVGDLLGPIIASFVPLVLILAGMYVGDTSVFLFEIRDYIPQITFLYAGWIVILWMGAFNFWTNYYLDILTITNKRIILINQKGFWRRNIGSFRLERLQDLNVEINGIIPTLLDYGKLVAETAGHSDEGFTAYGIPHPRQLKATILNATDALLDRNEPSSTTPQSATQAL